MSGAATAAPSRPARVADFDALLAARTGEKYAYCRSRFLCEVPSGLRCIACRDLLDADLFCDVIDRYTAKYGVADRRAVVSMWTMYYFSILMIGAAISWLELRRRLPLALDEMTICLDPETAEPRAFVLAGTGDAAPDLSIHAAIHDLFRRHVEPLVEAVADLGHISRKLLWANAAGYFSWAVMETGRQTDPKLAAEGSALLDQPFWPDGWKNPLHGMIRRECDAETVGHGRRRVCCLRYALPGVPGCGMVCPLPEGRF